MTEQEKEWIKRKDHFSKDDWWTISRLADLSEEFIEQNWDKLSHWDISGRQKLSEDFMRRHKDELQWFAICANQELSEEFMVEMADYVKWESRLINRYVPLSFLRQMQDYFDDRCWERIAERLDLNIDFIRQFKDKIKWNCLREKVKYEIASSQFKDKIKG